MIPGTMNERVKMGDWEAIWFPVGEIFDGSNWSEVALMLTTIEIPGLYIQPVKGLVYSIDHIEAKLVKKENGLPHKEQIAYPFSFVNFVQDGQNNRNAKDEFIYIYSPEGAKANKLTLARVPKDKIGIRNEWEYFTNYNRNNVPKWSDDITKRGYVYEYPEKSSKSHYFGWYSWLPSVVWNEGLGLYIMVNGGTYAGHGMADSDKDYYDAWMHTETGSLGFWYSKNPYGPWKQFFYTDHWIVDKEKNRTYQPKLSPIWISKDGIEMTLIWFDAMANEKGESHADNYLWNQMKINILINKDDMNIIKQKK